MLDVYITPHLKILIRKGKYTGEIGISGEKLTGESELRGRGNIESKVGKVGKMGKMGKVS